MPSRGKPVAAKATGPNNHNIDKQYVRDYLEGPDRYHVYAEAWLGPVWH